MKFFLLLIFISLLSILPSDYIKSISSAETIKDSLNLKLREIEPLGLKRVVPNSSFGVGERLEFSISYGPITAGDAVMEVKEITRYNNHKCFRLISTAKSNKFFSLFFKVDDRVESLMDVYGLFSLHFEKHLREGKYRTDKYIDFDQKKHLAFADGDTISIKEYVQDALSSLYYVRTMDLRVGNSVFMENHSDKKNYSLEIKVLRREKVMVPAGEFDCLVVEPMLRASGIFKHTGKLTVWLTNDKFKIPVLMKTKVAVGSIASKLEKYTLGEVGKY
ncbi:MAG: DUF3108 domain-containing protein [Candidatus Zixiibacteriota bacterium]